MLFGNRDFNCLVLIVVCTAAVSCAEVPPTQRPNWQQEEISSFHIVTGNWEGMTWMEPKMVREQNWAKVTIRKDGTFKFSAFRTIGAWTGEGKLQIKDGKLVSPRSDQEGTITMTLFKADGKLMLRVDASDNKGRIQRAELNPVKKRDKSDRS
jgi:hypothetical protein